MRFALFLCASFLCSMPMVAHAQEAAQHQEQQEHESGKAQVQKLSDHVYLLQGKGGNVGLSVGEDGLFLIDDDYAEVTPDILAAVKSISGEPVRFVLNTHWHNDHTGGNEIMEEQGGLIIAQDNVRKRLSEDHYLKPLDKEIKASPESALPEITYSEQATFHINGDDIRVFHVKNAHTDGDSVVVFPADNIIHTGDIFFNGLYPFIDTSTGGSLDGMIVAVEQVLAIADDNTKIISGHGPLATKADLQVYHDMLVGVHEKIAPLVAQGQSLDDIIKADPLAAYNAQWGNGFLPPEKFIGIVYESMTQTKP